ncbi:hypothetical protein D558_1527 [Bordetella holmesii 44057]|nr:hypothetical protein D558_1527 [Bordetella holmesii 44057]
MTGSARLGEPAMRMLCGKGLSWNDKKRHHRKPCTLEREPRMGKP